MNRSRTITVIIALASGGVLAIEWADKLPRPFDGSLTVRIEDAGDDNRTIRIES